MQPSEEDLLKRYAAKYMWWKPAEEAMQLPERIIAQVMNIGDYEDAQTLADIMGEDRLRQVWK
jgi:hypothetical protein